MLRDFANRFYVLGMVQVKVKFALEQAMKAQRGSRGIALIFHLDPRWGCVVNATPRPLYSRERDPVSIVHETGWALGPDWTGAENLATTGIRSGPSSPWQVATPN
jgi:hypothetical protein